MIEEPLTISKAIALSTDYLRKKGFPQARLEAELLLAKILSTNRLQLYLKFDQILNEEQKSAYREILKRRMEYEPIAYILGEREFLSRPFFVDRSVMIPRPETELLVETAIDILRDLRQKKNETLKVFEIGVGSGIISISIALENIDVEVVGSEISEKALTIAKKNAERHKVLNKIRFIKGNLFVDIKEKFDLIVSNPPYISEKDRDSLSKDVLVWEPHSALFAGEDGLFLIRKIISDSSDYLIESGFLVFEIGFGQDKEVQSLIEKTPDLKFLKIRKDLAGIPRVVIAQKIC